MNIRNLVAGTLAVALLACASVCAQDTFKPTNGPYGGNLFDYVVGNDGTVYAVTTNFDAYGSRDDGRTWSRLASNANDSTPQWLERVAVDSTGRVFIGGDHGIWHSIDGGASWTGTAAPIPRTNSQQYLQVRELQINRRGTVIAYYYSATDSVLVRSTDGGNDFARITLTDAGSRITSIMSTPSGAFLGGHKSGVYRSVDDGASWTKTSFAIPPGDTVRFLNSRQGVLWMISGIARQLYRSLDDGLSWEAIDVAGLPVAADISAITTTASGAVLATVESDGLYRSVDQGVTWERAGEATEGLVAAPSGTIIAGNASVFRSVDDGVTWNLSVDGLITTSITKMTEGADGTIYAASGQRPYRSSNRGATWEAIDNGVPEDRIRDVQFDSQGRLWISTNAAGVFRSIDKGNSWTRISAGLTTFRVLDLAFGPDGRAYAATDSGMHVSSDGGDSWSRIGGEFAATIFQVVDIGPDGAILAGTSAGGMLRSSDKGATWTPSNDGLVSPTILSLLVTRSGVIIAGTRGGIFRSLDSARTWQFVGRHHYATETRGLTEMRNGTIYAGAYDVARSMDNGLTWQLYLDVPFYNYFLVPSLLEHSSGSIFIGTLGAGVGEMVPDLGTRWKRIPVDASRVTAATSTSGLSTLLATNEGIYELDRGALAPKWSKYPAQIDGVARINRFADVKEGRLVVAATSDGLYTSLERGPWTKQAGDLPEGAFSAIAAEPIFGALYVGAADGIYFSLTEGSSWTHATSGPAGAINTFLVSGQAEGYSYAADATGVWRTADGGWNWVRASTGLPDAGVTSLTQSARGELFAAVSGAGIFRSVDRAATWTPAAGLSGREVTSIAINTFDVLFAGTETGVYRSDDFGATFIRVNTDDNSPVTSLTVTASGAVIATTETAGAFQSSPQGTAASIAERSRQVSASLALAIAGNPIVDRARLSFASRHGGDARLSIVDALGRESRVLLAGNLDVGEYTLDVERDGLAAGVWFVRLTQGEESVTVTMIVR
jgi:photosystem II stability/assembly factor-like uncharacterized protein